MDEIIPNGILKANYSFNPKTGNIEATITPISGPTQFVLVTKNNTRVTTSVDISSVSSRADRIELVKELKELNFTQADIAKIVGVSQSTVSNDLARAETVTTVDITQATVSDDARE